MEKEKHFSLTESLKFGFETVFRHIGFFAGVMLVVGLFFVLGSIALLLLKPMLAKLNLSLIPYLDKINGLPDQLQKSLAAIRANQALALLFVLFLIVFLQFFSLGFGKIELNFVDNKENTIRVLFSQARLLPRALAALVLYLFGIILGTVLFIIPGIIFYITFGFYKLIMIDEDAGIIESFKRSAAITSGARLQLFVMGMMIWLISLLVSKAFILSILFVSPALSLMRTYVYRKLKNATDNKPIVVVEK